MMVNLSELLVINRSLSTCCRFATTDLWCETENVSLGILSAGKTHALSKRNGSFDTGGHVLKNQN